MREFALKQTLYSWTRILYRIVQALLGAITNTHTPQPNPLVVVDEDSKIGGVYSADGHIVVRERRGDGNPRRAIRGQNSSGSGNKASSGSRPSALVQHGHHGHHSKHHQHHSRDRCGRPTAGPETARVRWQDHQEYHHREHREREHREREQYQSREQVIQSREQLYQTREQLREHHASKDKLIPHQSERREQNQTRKEHHSSRDPTREHYQTREQLHQQIREIHKEREKLQAAKAAQQSSSQDKLDLIPRAKLKHQASTASNYSGPSGGRGLRPSASCCEERPTRVNSIGLAHAQSSRTAQQSHAHITYQPSYTSPHMGDDLIEGRYEIYGSTKSSYSRETTYTLLPAENVVENKLAEECEEDSSGEEPSAASPDTVMEGPDKSKDLEVLPDDDDFEDPGYEKIMLAQVSECKKEGEEESTYEVVAKVAQQVTLLKQASPEPINENQGDDNLQIEEIIETPCDSLERVEIPIIVEAKPIDMSHYDTLVPRPPQPRTVEQRKEPVAPRALEQRKEPQPRSPELRKEQPRVVEQRIEPTQPRVLEQRKEPRTAEQRKELPKNRATEPRKEVPKQPAIESRKSNLPPAAPPLPVMEFKEEVHTRPSVVETVKAINNRNLRSAQSLELLSNRLFNKRGEEANKNVVTREMVKARSVDRVNQDIKEHGKFKGKRVTYHDSVDSLARRDFYRSAESAVDQTYLEEEFSYEPESKAVSSKVVMRTRSLVSLDDEQGFRGQPRGKITTGPDGSFRIGGRKANSELNLTDDSDHEHEKPKPVHHKPIDSGEQLKKKKQEMFKERSSKPVENDRFFKEINGGFSKTTKEQAIDNLKRYLKENKIGLRDLLINNNIVIIEPYRDENDRDISEYSTTGRIKKDKKCRITGAHLKDSGDKSKPESNTLPRANKPYQPTVQRHFFYRCFKTNQKYVDDDLPDPDKVRYARELFQRVGKYAAPEDTILMLPIAARPRDPQGPRTTPEVRVVDAPINKKPQHEQLRRWTDTGSQSSGVSSDMSEESREVFSEEEHEHEVVQPIRAATLAEAQPVSPEVMKKIRACGTSVTYYGGRMIARCEGPARSPMTMTILDEIRTCDQRRPSQDYMGVKFRLIKSNSCGSRLELAGTQTKLVRQDIFGGKSLNEELAELAECKNSRMERNESKIGHGSWRQLIETRKHARTRAHNSTPRYPEMEFEEFQVLE